MRIAIVHGYFLGDSGSAIYTRELAREFTREGHDVTLICQEQRPKDYDFIDCLYDFNSDNTRAEMVFERETAYSGRCRLVRPDIHGYLPTYVAGPFPPFNAAPLQDSQKDIVERYIEDNVTAMTACFDRWPQDLVQANHAVLQPLLVKKSLRGSAPYVVTIHGSELNFTVSQDPRMGPFLVEGLEDAAAVAALSDTSRADAIAITIAHGLDIEQKTVTLPPGVDTELFAPLAGRRDALAEISQSIDPGHDDIIVFAGRLMWTKGLHHVVAALPLILGEHPRLHLIIVGDGPMREPLSKFITLLENGKLAEARVLVENDQELKTAAGYGPVIPEMTQEEEKLYLLSALGDLSQRIHFTGQLSHERLAPLFGIADISLAPSVFPEAFGLVSIEALSAGALPVATYQTGLRSPLNVVADELGDEQLRSLVPGIELTKSLAALSISTLNKYRTRDEAHRRQLHEIAKKNFSWMKVAGRYIELSGRNTT